MRRTACFLLFAVIVMATHVNMAAPVKEQSFDARLRKQVEALAQKIDKQPEDRKLMYMVLMLHSRNAAGAVAFYERSYKEGKGDLFMRMAYAQALIAREQYAAAAGVLEKISRKYACHRMPAQISFLRGMVFLHEPPMVQCALGSVIVNIDSTYAPAYYMLGELTNEPAKAISYYVQTLALEQPGTELAKKTREALLDEIEASGKQRGRR